MRLCVISFKECWQAPDGRWWSSGGFPSQMRALRRCADHMVLVAVAVPPRPGGEPLPADLVMEPVPPPVGEDLRRKLSVVSRLGRYLPPMLRQARAADVVHAPVPGDLALLGLLVGLVTGRHTLGRYCGAWDSPPGEATTMNAVTRAVMRTAARRGHLMLATGLGRTPPAEGMHWIFASAISEEEVLRVRPDLDRLPGTPFRMAWAGRLSAEKGTEELATACAILERRHGSAAVPSLTIIGEGPERPVLEAALRAPARPPVEFVGQVPRVRLLELLGTVDVLVAPSRSEALGKARLDAFLCGAPVVTSNVGFARELVGSDGCRGWVVPPRDPDALATAMRTAMLHPAAEWPALRRRARGFAERYTLEAWEARLATLMRDAWGLVRAAPPIRQAAS